MFRSRRLYDLTSVAMVCAFWVIRGSGFVDAAQFKEFHYEVYAAAQAGDGFDSKYVDADFNRPPLSISRDFSAFAEGQSGFLDIVTSTVNTNAVMNWYSPSAGVLAVGGIDWTVDKPLSGNAYGSSAVNYTFVATSDSTLTVQYSLDSSINSNMMVGISKGLARQKLGVSLFQDYPTGPALSEKRFDNRPGHFEGVLTYQLKASKQYALSMGILTQWFDEQTAFDSAGLYPASSSASGTFAWSIDDDCPVGMLKPPPSPNDPPLPQPQYLFVNDLPQRVAEFKRLVSLIDSDAVFEVNSAYRSQEYQDHFLDIKAGWDSFASTRGDRKVTNPVSVVNGQLVPNLNDPEHVACLGTIAKINNEVKLHELGSSSSEHRLLVNEK